MSYKSILVNLDIDRPIASITKAAMELASRSGARLIGVCAADAPMPMMVPEAAYMATETWQQMRGGIEERIEQVHAAFRDLTAGGIETEWRGAILPPTDAIVAGARMADLVVMAAADGAKSGDAYRTADPASVVLRAGRPLLVIGSDKEEIPARKIVIGWKDTREARRAVADALPLLSIAYDVTVVTVTTEATAIEKQSVADVVSYLARHNVKAKSRLIKSSDETIGFLQFIDESRPDLIVTGAYGHSRVREWVFGGVTRFLLDETGRNRFMSC